MIQINKIIKTLAYTVLVGATSLCLLANAQQTNANNLPPCPKPDYSKSTDLGAGGRTEKWSNCWGTYRIELDSNYKGDVLEGRWLDGWLHGQATYTHANGNKYVGQYKNGYRHGQGTYYFLADNQWKGDKYVGEYRDGNWNGQGTYTHANGNKYVGEYRDGKSNGQGTYTYANGNKYVGAFKDGEYHGMGTDYYLADNQWKGDKYVGEFRDGKKLGQGTYTYANGDKYVGEFKDDKFHGTGVKILANGTRFEGIWENNSFIREAKVNLPNLNNNIATNADRADIERERQQLAEERRRIEDEKQRAEQTSRMREYELAEERRRLDQEKRQREQQRQSQRVNLQVTHTQPASDGGVTITIQTNADTASLKINGEEQGGKADGNYTIKRVARAGQASSFEIVATDVYGNSDTRTITVSRSVTDFGCTD